MCMETDKRVEQLEDRVSYLERQLGLNYEKEKFRKAIEYLAPDSATVDINGETFDRYARISDIDGDDVQRILEDVDVRNSGGGTDMEIKSKVTETGSGLSVEVWVDRY